MENKFKRFIIVQRPNGLEKYVMNHGATYNLIPDREYIHVIEYAALQDCKARIESAKTELINQGYEHNKIVTELIKQLESANAEIEKLQKKFFELDLSYQALQSGMKLEQLESENKKLADENAKLRAALENIVELEGVHIKGQTYPVCPDDLKIIAKKALPGKGKD